MTLNYRWVTPHALKQKLVRMNRVIESVGVGEMCS